MKRYVLGFAFYDHATMGRVVVMLRKRPDAGPESVRGKLNGLGGEINHGEAPHLAMIREFEEEAGCVTSPFQWSSFVNIVMPTYGVAIFVFKTMLTQGQFQQVMLAPGDAPEPVGVYRVAFEPDVQAQLAPHVSWLVPMALMDSVAGDITVLR